MSNAQRPMTKYGGLVRSLVPVIPDLTRDPEVPEFTGSAQGLALTVGAMLHFVSLRVTYVSGFALGS